LTSCGARFHTLTSVPGATEEGIGAGAEPNAVLGFAFGINTWRSLVKEMV